MASNAEEVEMLRLSATGIEMSQHPGKTFDRALQPRLRVVEGVWD